MKIRGGQIVFQHTTGFNVVVVDVDGNVRVLAVVGNPFGLIHLMQPLKKFAGVHSGIHFIGAVQI